MDRGKPRGASRRRGILGGASLDETQLGFGSSHQRQSLDVEGLRDRARAVLDGRAACIGLGCRQDPVENIELRILISIDLEEQREGLGLDTSLLIDDLVGRVLLDAPDVCEHRLRDQSHLE